MKGNLTYQKIFLLGLAVYLLALLCLAVSSGYTIYSNNKNLVQVAQEDLAHYLETGKFDPHLTQYQSNNFVYASDGRRVDFLTSDQAESFFDVDTYAQKLRGHLDSSPVYRVIFSLNLRYHFAIVVAIPIEDGGLFLFLKELPDVNQVLFSLGLGITLLCFLCVLGLLVALRGSRALEKLRREYVDNITHELKSPIAAVRALAEPIQDGMVRDEETLQRYSGIILSEISGLEHTVSYMLELSRLQHRRISAKKSPLSAQEVFQDTLVKYAALCDEFGLSFSIFPPLEECPTMYTNGTLAARMLEILLDNAFKFTEPHGKIQVRFTEQRSHITVSVINDGPAIEPADQKRIFERFYQSSKGRNQRGSGLGLAIAQEISRALKETLHLEHSTPEETVFSFTVSIARKKNRVTSLFGK